ncbi:Conserved hypothetical protein [Prochlorococcus marinus str. MIT 9313]|uniref:Uncharacterized protein n=1 Tax=Prochlorococcus marinus (strain MIT 9313) TaxID=74547 RepID=B9ES27_PROMM|nr:Conserved hypothetical protein [Prochlorococcus marinus str. MIT 9313]
MIDGLSQSQFGLSNAKTLGADCSKEEACGNTSDL